MTDEFDAHMTNVLLAWDQQEQRLTIKPVDPRGRLRVDGCDLGGVPALAVGGNVETILVGAKIPGGTQFNLHKEEA